MKRTLVACTLIGLFSIAAHAEDMKGMDMKGMDMKGMDMKGMDMKGMDMKGKDAKAKAHKGSGTVSKVDADKGTVTIAHGPVETMKWPAMTMTFKAHDKKMLGKLKSGDKVDFTFTQSGKDYVVTDIK